MFTTVQNVSTKGVSTEDGRMEGNKRWKVLSFITYTFYALGFKGHLILDILSTQDECR